MLGQPFGPDDLQFTAKIAELCHSMRHSPGGYIVTQHMHADRFLSQRRTGAGGYLNVFGEPMFEGVTA